METVDQSDRCHFAAMSVGGYIACFWTFPGLTMTGDLLSDLKIESQVAAWGERTVDYQST